MTKSTNVAFAILGLCAAGAIAGCAQPDLREPGPTIYEPSPDKNPDRDDDDPKARPEDVTPVPSPQQTPVAPPANTPPAAPLIYAHTADTLYSFDASSKKLSAIGKLACLSATDRLLDIAVDDAGAMFGTSDEAFLAINPADATCTRIVAIAEGSLPNSLSFVPAGILDATKPVLVGYAFESFGKAVRYVRIDTTDGRMTLVGNLNPPGASKKYVSSGDAFSVRKYSGRTFLTVREDGASASSPDLLAEVNPKTGAIERIVGNTLQSRIYGLAYWAGKAYGFSDDGNVTQINIVTGVSNIVTTLKRDDGTPVAWFAAGVTTEAPAE